MDEKPTYGQNFLSSENENLVPLKDNDNNLVLGNSSEDVLGLSGMISSDYKIDFSPKGRDTVFIFFLLSNILISMDHGSIPASVNELRSLTYYDQGIGLFGSLVYFGNLIGSIIVFSFINTYKRKTLLIIALVGNSLCLFTFVLIENIFFLFTNRVIVGLLQSYITIYMPVWCNQYGLQTRRNLMIALIQLVSPLGIFLGYFVASISIHNQFWSGWKFAFVVQAGLILLLSVCFLFVPGKFFSKNCISVGETKEEERIIARDEKLFKKASVNEDLEYFQKLKTLLNYKTFFYSVLGMSILVYEVTGVQYWVSDYFDNILGVKSAKDRLLLFTIAVFTAPTVGVFLGTIVKEKLCKDNIQKSLIFCTILGLFALIGSLLTPLTFNLLYFNILMWLVLFFGGGIVPVLTSIIINSVPEDLAASGNSISNFLTNALGYLPAPYVYGILSDISGDKGILGMRVTLWISAVGFIFFVLATCASFREKIEKKIK